MSLIVLILYRHTSRLNALVPRIIDFAHVDWRNISRSLLFLGHFILLCFLIFFILFVDETQNFQVMFAEVTLFLHLFDRFKHGSFLLFSLSSDGKSRVKHILFLVHELFASQLVIINLLLNFVSLILIRSCNSGDIIQSLLTLEQFLLPFDPVFIIALVSHVRLLSFLNCSSRKKTQFFLFFQLFVIFLDLHLIFLLLFWL